MPKPWLGGKPPSIKPRRMAWTRGRRHAQQEGFHAANEVEVVVDLLHGVGVGQAVAELQRADPGLHRVGRRHRRRHLGGVFGRGRRRSLCRSGRRGRCRRWRRLSARRRANQQRDCHEPCRVVHALPLVSFHEAARINPARFRDRSPPSSPLTYRSPPSAAWTAGISSSPAGIFQDVPERACLQTGLDQHRLGMHGDEHDPRVRSPGGGSARRPRCRRSQASRCRRRSRPARAAPLRPPGLAVLDRTRRRRIRLRAACAGVPRSARDLRRAAREGAACSCGPDTAHSGRLPSPGRGELPEWTTRKTTGTAYCWMRGSVRTVWRSRLCA